MRIESLEIKKLHELYDYDVKFNNDLTVPCPSWICSWFSCSVRCCRILL